MRVWFVDILVVVDVEKRITIRYAPCVIQAGFHNGVDIIAIFRICENRIRGQKLIQLGVWFRRARAQMIERVLETIFGREYLAIRAALRIK